MKTCVKNRDETTNKLDDVFKERTSEIDLLRNNCESLAKQVGKELVLEQKVDIQNKVIKELKQNLANAEESSKDDSKNEIEKLVHDISNLELENEKKVKMLKDVHEEKKTLEEKLEGFALMERNLNENNSLEQELSLAEKFKCTVCDDKFATRNEMKVHIKNIHETPNGAKLLKNQLSKKNWLTKNLIYCQKF